MLLLDADPKAARAQVSQAQTLPSKFVDICILLADKKLALALAGHHDLSEQQLIALVKSSKAVAKEIAHRENRGSFT